jgi:hypothetical protein
MVWSGEELLLFDHELVPQPNSAEPSLVRAAALDLETGSWRRLPDSEILSSGPWARDGRRLVNPSAGGADGGETNNWGRTYPYGGTFDLESEEWSSLPALPEVEGIDEGEEGFTVGVLTGEGATYHAWQGWLLDASTDTWLRVAPADEDTTGPSVVAAGDDLFAFGGVRWDGAEGTLLEEAWLWSPPARPAGA